MTECVKVEEMDGGAQSRTQERGRSDGKDTLKMRQTKITHFYSVCENNRVTTSQLEEENVAGHGIAE